MLNAIDIPHLAKGQKIAEYKKVYLASAAALTAEQQLSCLPVYIHRTEGEQRLAFAAAAKDTLANGFKFLEEIIDGKICIITECEKFFALMPKELSMDGIRSYYFELYELATRAEMQPDVFVKRFLTNIPGGRKLYVEKKAAIKADMTADNVTDFFKDIMEKLQKRIGGESPGMLSPKVIKEEQFLFPVYGVTESCEQIPEWARDLQREIGDLRCRVASNESGIGLGEERNDNEQQEVFAVYQEQQKRKSKNSCGICGKPGHPDQKCYKRICAVCNGMGHDAEVCPSVRKPANQRFNKQFGKKTPSSSR